MNELMIQNIAHTIGNLKGTMSSLEIAKLTGKRHDHVMRDIDEMLKSMESKGVPKGGDTHLSEYTHEQNGQKYKQWLLAKEDSLTLAAGYEPAIRKIIILRWAELECEEQQKPQISPRMQAINEWNDETTAISNVLSKLGYSQGYLRKEALEIGFRIEGETGEHFLPKVLVEDPLAVNPEVLSEYTGTHAAFVAMGSQGSSASSIAQTYGKDITPTDINKILVNAGFQTRISSGKYVPTEKAKMLCNQSTLASGKHKGTVIIKEWLYNSNKSLRDVISAGVQSIRLEKKMIDKS